MPSRRASKPTLKSAGKPKAAAPRAPRPRAAPEPVPPPTLDGHDRSRQKSRVRELTWASFDRLVQKMARSIQAGTVPQAVVGVAHGGVFVGGALASALGCEFYPVRLSRRSRDSGQRRAPKLTGGMPPELKGRRVLIVDDVAASGDTMELAKLLASKAGAKAISTACLVTRAKGYAPDWTGMTTEELVVFPWDYAAVAEDGRFDVDPDKAGA